MANPEITVLSTQALALTGWVYVPDVLQTANLPLFIWLRPLDDEGGDYVASIYAREERFDVGQTFGATDVPQYFGFKFVGDLSRVKPGSYRVSTLLPTGRDATAAIGTSSELYVHVG
jgi:hypothetical protein